MAFSASDMHPAAIAAQEQNWPVLKLLVTHPKFLALDQASRASIFADVRDKSASPQRSLNLVTEEKRQALSIIEATNPTLNDIPEKVNQLLKSDHTLDDPRAVAAKSLMVLALEQNRLDVVTRLLDAGYDKAIGYAEFLTATKCGSLNGLQLLADRCNFDFDVCKDNLLRSAAARGDFVIAKWLLSHSANPDAVDQRGMSALDAAKKYPHSVTSAEVERLIQSRKP